MNWRQDLRMPNIRLNMPSALDYIYADATTAGKDEAPTLESEVSAKGDATTVTTTTTETTAPKPETIPTEETAGKTDDSLVTRPLNIINVIESRPTDVEPIGVASPSYGGTGGMGPMAMGSKKKKNGKAKKSWLPLILIGAGITSLIIKPFK